VTADLQFCIGDIHSVTVYSNC